MTSLFLKTNLGSSKIVIGHGLLKKLKSLFAKKYPGSRFTVIWTRNIEKRYGRIIHNQLPGALILTIPNSEFAKDLKTVTKLCSRMLKGGIGRKDVVIGMGGGMVIDMSGFLASIYMRGLTYIAIPTTLLGMADAAIGGKNALDFEGVKNILGTVYLTNLIINDTAILEDLPKRLLSSGFGEIIKYAALIKTSLFKDLAKKPLPLNRILIKAVQTKMDVVKQDIKDTALRKILNYGHTFGHAIEAATHYRVMHGEAVSIGMVIANRIAQKLGKQNPKVDEKIQRALRQFHLPTELPKGLSLKKLLPWIRKDKKRSGNTIDFVIVRELGKPEIVKLTPKELVSLASK